ncbi:MAG: hypothetical protein R3A50_00280 [Saprospiraceae bacterium]
MNLHLTPIGSFTINQLELINRLRIYFHFFLVIPITCFAYTDPALANHYDLPILPGDSTIVATICANEVYEFNGELLDQSGDYMATYTAFDGSDSILTLQLTVLPLQNTIITESICPGSTYSFNGLDLSDPGEYSYIATGENGCDSIAILQLELLPISGSQLEATICFGESYPFFGASYSTTGAYQAILVNQYGCDSVIILNLSVLPEILTQQSAAICTGSSYLFAGEELFASGQYHALYSAENGCDSLVVLELQVVDYFDQVLTVGLCQGDSYQFGDIELFSPGTYVDSLQASGGCDSVITLQLQLLPTLSSQQHLVLCEGSAYEFNGDVLTDSDIYVAFLTGSNGCDSIVTLNLEFVPYFETALEATICEGEVYTLGAQELDASGVYQETLSASGGCDSILTLTLTVIPQIQTELHVGICNGATYDFNGEAIDEEGIYTQVLSAENGCDSTITLTLSVLPTQETNIYAVTCEGTAYEYNGEELAAAGIYTYVYQAENGCDSTVILSLSVLPTASTNIEATQCSGGSYEFDGILITDAGVYSAVYQTAQGCDSTVTLTLTFVTQYELAIDAIICENEPFVFGTDTLSTEGEYTQVFQAEGGCDSLVTLSLVVLPGHQTELTASICHGEIYSFNGSDLTDSGVYSFVLAGANGCDSIVTLTLEVLPVFSSSLEAVICANEVYVFNGEELSQGGLYLANLAALNGCDSTVTLNLIVLPISESSETVELCSGEVYVFDGEMLSESGTFSAVYEAANGCDSLFTLNLLVHPVYSTELEVNMCTGQSYEFNGAVYDVSGVYVANLQSVFGCDSTISLHLNFVDQFESSFESSICAGEEFVFGTDVLNESGEYSQTFQSSGGCDSLVTLTLHVLTVMETEYAATICSGESYPFNGVILTDEGSYTAILSAVNGCDSMVTVLLTVLPVSSSAVPATICTGESYSFDGHDLTDSGEYTAVFTSENGCDSTVVLDLNVLPEIAESIEATICANESYNFNGVLLSIAGVYSSVLVAESGCDSTVTLNLGVLEVAQSSVLAGICAGQEYDFYGETINQSGVYTKVFPNAAVNGCDSIVELQLSVYPMSQESLEATICAGEIFEFNGQVLDAEGTYTSVLVNSYGCDSIQILQLSVLPLASEIVNISICEGDAYEYNGEIYETEGEYSFVIEHGAANGCDSIFTFVLEVIPNPTVSIFLDNGTLTAVSSAGNFQWIDCGAGSEIPGETGASFTPLVSGQYAVGVTSSAGCIAMSDCISVTISGTVQPQWQQSWQLAPNPAKEESMIVFGEMLVSDLSLQIYDATGKLLEQQIVPTGTDHFEFKIGAFNDGILWVKLLAKDSVSIKMLVKSN